MVSYYLKRKIASIVKFVSHYLGIKKYDREMESGSVFVVGCSHSGTTLLATVLGRHNDIFAIGEETYIFGQSSYFAKSAIYQWDILCRQFGKKLFLEKTPKHVYEIHKIFRLLPDSKIVFIVRNPVDNIASLVKRNDSLEFSIKKWINDNKNLLKYLDDERVFTCYFDKLVVNPEKEIEKICRFIGVDFDEKMLTDTRSPFSFWEDIGQQTKELRYTQVTQPIKDTRGKGRAYFDNEKLKLIEEKTSELAGQLGIPSFTIESGDKS